MSEDTLQKNKEHKTKQEELAQRYLKRYMAELQRHFSLTDESLKKILLKSASIIKGKNVIQKFLSMIRFNKKE